MAPICQIQCLTLGYQAHNPIWGAEWVRKKKPGPLGLAAAERRNHMSDFLKVLNERTSAEHFDSATPISVQEIKELISEACQAPSSFNIQHWRFIAVTDERMRERLKGTTIAPNQERVTSAPLICLILGDLNGHKRLKGILDETVHAGLLPREVADLWFTMANDMYGSDPRVARDEAIRSGSLAAMALMLAAGNRGYVTCPIGFNPVQVMEILSISDHYVPVMMLAVGRPASGNTPRRPRLSVDQVLAFNISPE
jgi:nitroreductase